jgi:1,2-phenylacetyl-CoA epoxidase PaaB subunit
MAKQPTEPPLFRWEIFKIASKSVWVGSVEAPDEAAAIQKAADEFKIDGRRLYARRR